MVYDSLPFLWVTQKKTHQKAWPGCSFVIKFGVIRVLFLLATQIVGHRDVKVCDLHRKTHGWRLDVGLNLLEHMACGKTHDMVTHGFQANSQPDLKFIMQFVAM